MGNCAVHDCNCKHGKKDLKCTIVQVPSSLLNDYQKILNRPIQKLPKHPPRICTCHLDEGEHLISTVVAGKVVKKLRDDIKPTGTCTHRNEKIRFVSLRSSSAVEKRAYTASLERTGKKAISEEPPAESAPQARQIEVNRDSERYEAYSLLL